MNQKFLNLMRPTKHANPNKRFHIFQDGVENKGTDCWAQCWGIQGPCPQFCGKGLCCKYGWEDTSGGCDGSIGVPGRGHVCSADPNYVKEESE